MSAPSPTTAPLLAVRDLKVTFRTGAGGGLARAVDGLDFTIQAGETVGLVGESGCGKTVASLALLRLVDQEGHISPGSSVRLEGRELLALPLKEMQHVRGNHVAIVFQEPATALNPVLTVGDQIAEVVRTHERVGAADAWRRTVDMLAMVGMPDPAQAVHAYPHQLSGGMLQRALIAMALVCRPKLLIADEPTTALDVTIQAEILELLKELQQRIGMAVLLITHNLGIVAETTRRVYVMYAGQVVEEAPTERLFAAPAHPYTEGLLAAVPRVDAPADRLAAIPGQVPPATAWPQGCRFHPRCPYAWQRCVAEQPPLLEAQPGHAARCWLVSEPGRRAVHHRAGEIQP